MPSSHLPFALANPLLPFLVLVSPLSVPRSFQSTILTLDVLRMCFARVLANAPIAHFRALLANGTRLADGARALTEGGLQSLPRLAFLGGAFVGRIERRYPFGSVTEQPRNGVALKQLKSDTANEVCVVLLEKGSEAHILSGAVIKPSALDALLPCAAGDELGDPLAHAEYWISIPHPVRQARVDANAAGFVEGLPNGYDTLMGERGFLLSGAVNLDTIGMRGASGKTLSAFKKFENNAVDMHWSMRFNGRVLGTPLHWLGR
ncbi:hypothetical protein K438DRAFT_2061441 [Mycena galopus ATCC 62051]|nr:hypothetical protein K438DRAFT_2061441 [Mycena galopus ATCC 62051]